MGARQPANMLCGRDVVGMLYMSVGCQRRAWLTDMCVVREDSFIQILPISREEENSVVLPILARNVRFSDSP